jgi:hypothetical protein
MGKNDGLILAGAVVAAAYLVATNVKLNIASPSLKVNLPNLPDVNSAVTDVSSWINGVLDSQYPVSSYVPQVGLSNILGKVTYTPALVGPLSSTNPDDWRSWLI